MEGINCDPKIDIRLENMEEELAEDIKYQTENLLELDQIEEMFTDIKTCEDRIQIFANKDEEDEGLLKIESIEELIKDGIGVDDDLKDPNFCDFEAKEDKHKENTKKEARIFPKRIKKSYTPSQIYQLHNIWKAHYKEKSQYKGKKKRGRKAKHTSPAESNPSSEENKSDETGWTIRDIEDVTGIPRATVSDYFGRFEDPNFIILYMKDRLYNFCKSIRTGK